MATDGDEAGGPSIPDGVAIIVQARMSSSRLPGKVLRKLGEHSVLGHMLRRLQRVATPSSLIVATTVEPTDDAIVDEAQRFGALVYRGPVDDVLGRYWGAAQLVDAQVIVRLSADCPLIDPGEVDRVVATYLSLKRGPEPRDYVSNQSSQERRAPRGWDVEVFSRGALQRAHEEAAGPGEREHVTPYLYQHAGRFRTKVTHPPGPDRSHLRLTVDTPEDLRVVTAIVDALGDAARIDEIEAFLGANPEIAAINAKIAQRGTQSEHAARRLQVAGRTLLGRADGGASIGFGHLARLEALLDAWTQLGGRAVLAAAGLGGAIRSRLLAAGVQIVDRDPEQPPGSAGDAAATRALAEELEACALVIDGYGFGGDFQSELARHRPLLAVDDLAELEPVADVILNQNGDFDPARYGLAGRSRLLVGYPYVLLRREFRQVTSAPSHSSQRDSVLVSFGGTDPARLTVPVVEALLPALPDGLTIVAMAGSGMADEDRARLNALESAREPAPKRLRVVWNVTNVAPLFRSARAAITAAGSTVWELLACGVPVLGVTVAENQRVVAAALQGRHVGVDLGWYTKVTPALIRAALMALLADEERRAKMATSGRALIDGRGAWRAIDALLEAIERREARA